MHHISKLKLKCNGINGNLLKFSENYLKNSYQWVVSNDTVPEWRGVTAGVLQVSVLGPLSFLVNINDVTDNISCHMRLFANDSSLVASVEGTDQTHEK